MHFLAVLTACVWIFSAAAESSTVLLSSGQRVHAEILKGDPDKPVFVFINGLTQDTSHWKTLAKELSKARVTAVFYDNPNQGQSLLNSIEEQLTAGQFPTFPRHDVEQEVENFKALLQALNITVPVYVVGLSYGGSVGLQLTHKYPELVRELFLIAPFTKPLGQQDYSIRSKIEQIQLLFPQLQFAQAQLYDWLLLQSVLTSYPQTEPTIIKWHPFFQPFAAFALIQGVRTMNSEVLAKGLKRKLHLIVAGQDQYITEATLNLFWELVPESFRGQMIKVLGVEHKVNESVGPTLARILIEVANHHPWWQDNTNYEIDPRQGEVKNLQNGHTRQIEKDNPCEWSLLRPTFPLQPNLPIDRIKRF